MHCSVRQTNKHTILLSSTDPPTIHTVLGDALSNSQKTTHVLRLDRIARSLEAGKLQMRSIYLMKLDGKEVLPHPSNSLDSLSQVSLLPQTASSHLIGKGSWISLVTKLRNKVTQKGSCSCLPFVMESLSIPFGYII